MIGRGPARRRDAGLLFVAVLGTAPGLAAESPAPGPERAPPPEDPPSGGAAVPLELLDFLLLTDDDGAVLDALLDALETRGRLPPQAEEESR